MEISIKNGKVTIEIDIPKTCGECLFYTCEFGSLGHNERGYESDCKLGFMKGEDMRDVTRYRNMKYEKCKFQTEEEIQENKIRKEIEEKKKEEERRNRDKMRGTEQEKLQALMLALSTSGIYSERTK